MLLIDGKKIAAEIQAEIAQKIASLKGRKPGLSFLLVGDHPASQSYIRAKKKACAEVGIISDVISLSATIAESDLLHHIERLNHDPAVDGILVQLPLPPHINEKAITSAIDPAKDVDGFHPLNVGKMLLGEEGGFLPCTPHGIQVVLERSQIPVEGKHVVIVGRSNIVGKPLAAILMQKKPHCNATVTIVHSQSENLSLITRSADILVAAIGRPHFIRKEMVKPKATVIDVGINRLPDGKIVGDVDFETVFPLVSHITPVPGGIGPMTIAMLLKNTLQSFLQFVLLLLLFTSCQKHSPCTYFSSHTEPSKPPYTVTIGKHLSRSMAHEVQILLTQINQKLAHLREEIDHLNKAPPQTCIPLSLSLQYLLSLSSEVATLSQGRFDPTIAPLASLWSKKIKPSPEELQSACDALGWKHISLQNGIFQKDAADTQLALDALLKGFWVDEVATALQQKGITDFFIEWAGHFRAHGCHPEGRDWVVEVNPDFRVNQQPMAPIPLRGTSLVMRTPQEIIDPFTAAPLEKSPASVAAVAVIAPSCTLADALATAALLFYPRKTAESWAQEIVEIKPEVSFWIVSYRQ